MVRKGGDIMNDTVSIVLIIAVTLKLIFKDLRK